MELLLIKEKVWDTISSSASSPCSSTWTDKDNTARALIGLNVDDNQLSHIRNQTTAKGVWEALKNIHENDSVVNLVTLIREMYATKMEEGDDLQTHLDKLSNLFEKIYDLGEKLSDTMKIGIILSSLPISWDTLVTAFEVRKKDELTMSLVLSKLSDEEIRRKIHPTQREEKILKIGEKQRFYKRPSTSGDREKANFFCFFCKQRNHIMRNCMKFKEYSENNKANLMTEDAEEYASDDDDYLLTLSNVESNMNDEIQCSVESNNVEWTLDSGATSHISNDEKQFEEIISLNEKKVKVANGIKIDALGRGVCKLQLKNEKGNISNAKLNDVLYVPEIKGNFISMRKLTQKGYKVTFYEEKADITLNEKDIATAKIKNELYKLTDEVYTINELRNKKQCIHYYHHVFGHRNIESIKRMLNQKMVFGIELKNCNCGSECTVCLKSKMTRKSFKKLKPKVTTKNFELIHTDLCGSMRTQTHTNRKYILTFIDDFSHYSTVYLLERNPK